MVGQTILTVGRTFLSAEEKMARLAGRNVCPPPMCLPGYFFPNMAASAHWAARSMWIAMAPGGGLRVAAKHGVHDGRMFIEGLIDGEAAVADHVAQALHEHVIPADVFQQTCVSAVLGNHRVEAAVGQHLAFQPLAAAAALPDSAVAREVRRVPAD